MFSVPLFMETNMAPRRPCHRFEQPQHQRNPHHRVFTPFRHSPSSCFPLAGLDSAGHCPLRDHPMEGDYSYTPNVGHILEVLQPLLTGACTDEEETPRKHNSCCAGSRQNPEAPKEDHPCRPVPKESKSKPDGERSERMDVSQLLKTIFADVLKQAEPRRPKKWQQRVDCRGFKSGDIKVKISDGSVKIRACKEEEFRGNVSRDKIERFILLPEDVDITKVSCRLLPQGHLLVDAPFVEKPSQSESEENKKSDEKSGLKFNVRTLPSGVLVFEHKKQEKGHSLTKTQEEETVADEARDDEKVKKNHKLEETCQEKKDANNAQTEEESVVPVQQTNQQLAEQPIITFPGEDSKDLDKDDNDNESTTSKGSEDSFILLTDAEQETTHADEEKDEPAANETKEDKDVPQLKHIVEDIVGAVADAVHNHQGKSDSSGENMSLNNVLENITSFITDNRCDITQFVVPTMDSEQKKTTKTDTVPGQEDQQAKETSEAAVIVEHPRNDAQVNEFQVRLEMPLYDPESLQVYMDDGNHVLNIMAKKEGSHGSSGSADVVNKSIDIPETVELDHLKCHFRDGMLIVSAPYKKGEEKKSFRNIPVML